MGKVVIIASAVCFGTALAHAKQGAMIAREGWNGENMFAYVVPEAAYPAQTGVAKAYFGEDAKVPYRAYLALKTAQGDVATWAPSGSDVLAEDWLVLDIQEEQAEQADTDNSSQTLGVAGCGPYTDPMYGRMRALELAVSAISSGNVAGGDPVDMAEKFVKFING
jgi:hypothetical protein